MKILVVEDHPALAEMSVKLLQEIYDHVVAHTTTGEGALEEFSKLQPEMVLVDIHLPDMDGYEVARRLRTLPNCATTVLVALTASGDVLDEATVHAAGFDAHFRKPMDFDLIPSLRRRT